MKNIDRHFLFHARTIHNHLICRSYFLLLSDNSGDFGAGDDITYAFIKYTFYLIELNLLTKI